LAAHGKVPIPRQAARKRGADPRASLGHPLRPGSPRLGTPPSLCLSRGAPDTRDIRAAVGILSGRAAGSIPGSSTEGSNRTKLVAAIDAVMTDNETCRERAEMNWTETERTCISRHIGEGAPGCRCRGRSPGRGAGATTGVPSR
jgi:hypothetical protein